MLNHIQILEQMVSFSLQQHSVKDKLIEDLQAQIAELKKKYEPAPQPQQ